MGVQCWNSYTNPILRPVNVFFTNDFSMLITNNFGAPQALFTPLPMGTSTNVAQWPVGFFNNQLVASSFQALFSNTVAFSNYNVQLSPGNYITNRTVWNPLTYNPATKTYFQPDWGIIITNRVRVIMTDAATGRILDYVQLGGLGQSGGLESQDDVATNLYVLNYPNATYNIWNPTPTGIFNQYQISSVISGNQPLVNYTFWASLPNGVPGDNGSVLNGIQGFQKWILSSDPGPKQMPFAPTVQYAKVYTWGANDPLVHYTVGDLTDLTQSATNVPQLLSVVTATNVLAKKLTTISQRYRPWGNNAGLNPNMKIVPSDEIEFKDPMIRQSQDWQFLTNKYPTVGWIGRVHRGTPWQTVYLKSHGPGYLSDPNVQKAFLTAWQYWTGNTNASDAFNTQPTMDLALLDLFTTSPNDNASRGQLSVNQTNLAAWAAVLDGVMVISNGTKGMVATNIDLTQSNSVNGNLVQYLVSSISAQRAAVGGTFLSGVGQIFSTPQLTVASPYLNTSGNPSGDTNLTDAVYERIPQQIASLLRVGTPRYEIYAYGQSLKPADKSIVQSGPSFGLCTNYQITGEVLTRTVVRFDNPPAGTPQSLRPGTQFSYPLQIQGQNNYAVVTNVIPPVRAVVESFQILGPDQ
jgi:hypothetical protein